jgi:hypothetical protein
MRTLDAHFMLPSRPGRISSFAIVQILLSKYAIFSKHQIRSFPNANFNGSFLVDVDASDISRV